MFRLSLPVTLMLSSISDVTKTFNVFEALRRQAGIRDGVLQFFAI